MLTENGFVGNPLRTTSDQQCTSKFGSDAIVDDKDKDTVEICRRSIQKRYLIALGLIAFLIVAIIIVVPCVILIPKKGRVYQC